MVKTGRRRNGWEIDRTGTIHRWVNPASEKPPGVDSTTGGLKRCLLG